MCVVWTELFNRLRKTVDPSLKGSGLNSKKWAGKMVEYPGAVLRAARAAQKANSNLQNRFRN